MIVAIVIDTEKLTVCMLAIIVQPFQFNVKIKQEIILSQNHRTTPCQIVQELHYRCGLTEGLEPLQSRTPRQNFVQIHGNMVTAIKSHQYIQKKTDN